MITIPRTIRHIVALGAVIFTLRMLFIHIYTTLHAHYDFSMMETIEHICHDNITVVALSIFLLLFTIVSANSSDINEIPIGRLIKVVGYVVASTIVLTLIYNRGQLLQIDDLSTLLDLEQRFIPSLITLLFVNLILTLGIEVIIFMRASRRAIVDVTAQHDRAQYQYAQLKQQLNPHFLFNSLNILDYLVANGESKQASRFINKLASVYRYLLTQESDRVVTLHDEIEFTQQYIDLLHERFGDALRVEINIDESLLKRHLIPFGLMITIENGVKHNVVNMLHPLTITIDGDTEKITVRNKIQHRATSTQESTGIGLTNLDRQYNNVAGLGISHSTINDEYVVELPLLK